jgi:hypothetical protein
MTSRLPRCVIFLTLISLPYRVNDWQNLSASKSYDSALYAQDAK